MEQSKVAGVLWKKLNEYEQKVRSLKNSTVNNTVKIVNH